jgi:hypothetical protein
LYPWLLAIAILAILFVKIPLYDFHNIITKRNVSYLSFYVIFQILVVLLADAYATRISFAVTGVRVRFAITFFARGATYLVGILNYALGQGAMGIYLNRCGIKAIQGTGVILFMIIINLGVLILVACLGLLIGDDLPNALSATMSLVGLVSFASIVVYLVIVAKCPRFLHHYAMLTPLWDAGLRGHLFAAAGRLPHVLILVLTHWGAMRLWGIHVPLSIGVMMVPIVLFIAALPITPAGLGSVQGIQVILFSPYANALTPEARSAEVLVFSLVYYCLGVSFQVLLGFYCWRRLRCTV